MLEFLPRLQNTGAVWGLRGTQELCGVRDGLGAQQGPSAECGCAGDQPGPRQRSSSMLRSCFMVGDSPRSSAGPPTHPAYPQPAALTRSPLMPMSPLNPGKPSSPCMWDKRISQSREQNASPFVVSASPSLGQTALGTENPPSRMQKGLWTGWVVSACACDTCTR
jgi:hypothetical protein